MIYSYRITPIIEEHIGDPGLRGEIGFEPDFCHDRNNLLPNSEFLYSKETLSVKPHEYKHTTEIAIQKSFDSVECVKSAQK